jgi:hypothetical protein
MTPSATKENNNMSSPITPIAPISLSVSPTNIAIAFGATVQLVPVLTGSDGNPFSPTKPLVYSSSNDALLTVDSSGLCTAVTPDDPNALSTGGVATITVSYPFQNRTDSDAISAASVIKVLATTAKTQIVVRGIPASTGLGSGNLVSQVVPATAPEPSYPPGWSISN